MGTITKTKTWADQDNVNYTDINANFDTLYTEINGSLDNANIDASANIAYSKLDIQDGDITAAKIDGTAMTLSSTDTVTGTKTFKKTIQTLVTATDASTVTFDLSAGNIQSVTLADNRILALSNVSTGQVFILRLIQDTTGSRTVTWFSTIKWSGGSAPTLTTTASKTDVFGFICTSTGNYDGYVIGQNL